MDNSQKIIVCASVLFFHPVDIKRPTRTYHFGATLVLVDSSNIQESMNLIKSECKQSKAYQEFLEFSIEASKNKILTDGTIVKMETGKLYWNRFSEVSSAGEFIMNGTLILNLHKDVYFVFNKVPPYDLSEISESLDDMDDKSPSSFKLSSGKYYVQSINDCYVFLVKNGEYRKLDFEEFAALVSWLGRDAKTTGESDASN